MGHAPDTPYQDRTDFQKIATQWTKLSGLHDREEWSAAVVRAVTAAEVAANLAIRAEYAKRSPSTKKSEIDDLLRKANGLPGKMDRFIRLLFIDRQNDLKTIEALYGQIDAAIKARNKIVHSGEFSNKVPATTYIAACKAFVEGLVRMYDENFELPDPKDTNRKDSKD